MADTTVAGMPPRVRTWLDYELAHAAYWAGRSTAEPGDMPPDPSPDELCAALPLAADQLERVKIIAELRSQLYFHEDILMGELYLAAQQHPDRMDHLYDFIGAAGRARKELGPDVVRWLADLGEWGHDGIDMEAAGALVRALHVQEEWNEATAAWGEMVDAALVPRRIWHDGTWRHRTAELIELHRAEFDAVVRGHATPEQLAAWKLEWQAWPATVMSDQDGPWVVAEQWQQFLDLKHLPDTNLEVQHRNAQARTERKAAHLKLLRERLERLEQDYEESYTVSRRLQLEFEARHGGVMRQLTAAEVESAIELNTTAAGRA